MLSTNVNAKTRRGGVIDSLKRFKLVLRVTRKLRQPHFTLGTTIEVIEGNPNIIQSCRVGLHLNREGGITDSDIPVYKYDNLVKTLITPNPGELYACYSQSNHVIAYGFMNVRYQLINGKYIYLKFPEKLAGLLDYSWDANGGVNSGIITLTEADAYTI